MLLSCNNLNKAFLERPIISDCSFHLEEHDKAAIVGMNGAGKTTLLRMIVGELAADSGTIVFAKNSTFGYLSQQHNVNSSHTIWEELLSVKNDLLQIQDDIHKIESQMNSVSGPELEQMMERYNRLTHTFELNNGYAIQSEITGLLKGLGFMPEEFSKSISQLSGGQKTRVALAKILLKKPSLIILDEPTNHLDIPSIQFLEGFIKSFSGCVLIVSHDRYFLDRTVNKVIEIENAHVTSFRGNYTDYAQKREQLRIAAWNAYANQQKMIQHQEQVIEKLKSFNREKSIKRAESREKMLAKVEVLDKPLEINQSMKIRLTPHTISGNDVLSIRHLSKAFEQRQLFRDCNIEIKRGEHVALIGENGTGKTTLFKILNHLIEADTGECILGSQVVIGYYDQEHQILDGENTLFEEISDAYPDLTNTEIRNTLASFLFTNDDVFKLVRELSGGEQGRLCLAKLMLSDCNFLVLDEPTNHLDITSKEILENAINQYEGTCFFISHDRYFVNKTASRILELENQQFNNYLGNYDYYLEKKESSQNKNDCTSSQQEDTTISASANDWKASKEQQAQKRKRENDLKKTEQAITDYETQIKELEGKMLLPENSSNVSALQELSSSVESLQSQLNLLYEKWEQLA